MEQQQPSAQEDVRVYAQDGRNLVAYVLGGQTFVGSSGASWQIPLKADSASALAGKVHRHFKGIQVDVDRLGFVAWATPYFASAVKSKCAQLPLDFEGVFGRAGFESGQLRDSNVSVCFSCTQVMNPRRKTVCGCKGGVQIKCTGILCGQDRNFNPLLVAIPVEGEEAKRLKTLLYGSVTPSFDALMRLQQQVAELQAQLAQVSTVAEQAVGGATSSVVAGIDTFLLGFDFNQDTSKRVIDETRTASANRNAATRHEHMLREQGLAHLSQEELMDLFKRTQQDGNDPVQIKMVGAALQVLESGQSYLQSAPGLHKMWLYQRFGIYDKHGSVEGLTGGTLKKYFGMAMKRIAFQLWRDESQLGRTFKADLELAFETQIQGGEKELDAAMLTTLVKNLLGLFISSNYQVNNTANGFVKGLLIRLGEDKSDAIEQEDEDDEAWEMDGDQMDGPRNKICFVSPMRAGQIFAALRYAINCTLVVAFRYRKDKEMGFVGWIDKLVNAEFPRSVNLFLSNMRQIAIGHRNEVNSIAMQIEDGRVRFVTHGGTITLEEMGLASKRLREEVLLLFSTGDQDARDALEQLFTGIPNPGLWEVYETGGKHVRARGGGFGKVEDWLARNCKGNGLDSFARQLKLILGVMIAVESSALLRTSQLFLLHVDLDDSKVGTLRVNNTTFAPFSVLEVDALSFKAMGASTAAKGLLGVVVSTIAAILWVVIPEVFEKHVALAWVREQAPGMGEEEQHLYARRLRALVTKQQHSMRLVAADAPWKPFDQSVGFTETLLARQGLIAFQCALEAKAAAVFKSPTLTLALFRKVMSTYNANIGRILKLRLDSGKVQGGLAVLFAEQLESMNATRDALQYEGFGDGGAHRAETQAQWYQGLQQGSCYGFSAFQVLHMLLRSKLLLLEDAWVMMPLADGKEEEEEEEMGLRVDEIDQYQLAVARSLGHALSNAQIELLAATIAGGDIVLVAGCGGGKTSTNIAIANQYKCGVTVMYLPTLALAQSVEAECDKQQVPFIRYSKTSNVANAPLWRKTNPTRIVVVVYETGASKTFTQWLGVLARNGLLNRIVIDEAHMLMSASGYRTAVGSICGVREHYPSTPITIMSGTMTTTMQDWLVDTMQLKLPTVIKGAVTFEHWENVEVQYASTSDALKKVELELRQSSKPFKAIVFTMSVDLTRTHAKTLGDSLEAEVLTVSSANPDVTNEHAVKQLLKAHNNNNLLVVATSKLALGANVLGVTHVFALGAYDVLDLVQEWGRCGRGGLVGKVYLLAQAIGVDKEFAGMCARLGVNEEAVGDVMGKMSVKLLLDNVARGGCALEHLGAVLGNRQDGSGRCGRCTGCNDGEELVLAMDKTEEDSVVVEQEQVAHREQVAKRPKIGVEAYVEEFQRLESRLIGLGKETCLLCGIDASSNHFPNDCTALGRTRGVYCNTCFAVGVKHSSPHTCQAVPQDLCVYCARLKVNCHSVHGRIKMCGTFYTHRQVLLLLFYKHKKATQAAFQDAPMGTMAAFRTWALTKRVTMGGLTANPILVAVLGFYWQEVRPKI